MERIIRFFEAASDFLRSPLEIDPISAIIVLLMVMLAVCFTAKGDDDFFESIITFSVFAAFCFIVVAAF